ncbi:DUF3108 domain-containing protein [Dongia sp. agr-C8]
MPRLTGCLASALGLVLLAVSASDRTAQAASAQIADLKYEVYVGGLHIYSLDVEMVLQSGRYRLSARGGTQGMVGMVYTWDTNLVADGLDQDGRVEALRFHSQTQWQSRRRTVELGFGADGRYALRQDPPPEPDPDIEGGLPQALPAGIVDPLSFAISAARLLAKTGRCDQTVPVFDGQRRFNVIVTQLGAATLQPNRYSIYQGPAMRCGLGIERISGFRKSLRAKREQEERSTPPTIWVAQVRPELPPIPVRYDGEIALGKIVVHLTDARFRSGSN